MADNESILTHLRGAAGDDSVLERGGAGAKPYTERYGAQPVAVVLPGSIEELQKVVVGASELNYSLWVLPNTAGNGAMLGSREQATVLVD